MSSGLPAPASPPGGDRFRKPAAEPVEVGEFPQGSPLSRWALARYLVGRAVAESLGWSLLTVGVLVLVLAVLSFWAAHLAVLGVLLVVIAVGLLLMRAVLLGAVRRLTGFAHYRPVEDRMRALIDDTSKDVRAELRRIGLPSHMVTLPLIAVRLLRRSRRAQTLERLRAFDTARAVPKARLDELHLVLRSALGGGESG